MVDQPDSELTKSLAINVVLHSMGERMFALIASYLKSRYGIEMNEEGDLSCSLYELSLALEQLLGENAARLIIQDVYVEIDALADMLQKEKPREPV